MIWTPVFMLEILMLKSKTCIDVFMAWFADKRTGVVLSACWTAMAMHLPIA